MSAALRCPSDFAMVFHHSLSDGYELSKVLLASAAFDGTLQLLTSGWERALGYGRQELESMTLCALMWSDARRAAAAVAAVLDRGSTRPVELRVRCRNGLGKCFTLHRRYDEHEQIMYIVAEETPARTTAGRSRAERRAAPRPAL